MKRIQALNEECVNQIAAGEVIERPASVVKELVENALDAGANQIEIYIENGGKSLIQVRDNGHGIHFDDFEICFQRFTTSKIQKAEDIFYISSNGFRGEALSSIASISRLELASRTEDAESARSIEVQGMQLVRDEQVARGRGTTISVFDLFYNTPVRLKFLSSVSAEIHRITQIVTKISLANPECRIRLNHNSKDILTARSNDPKERIGELMGVKWIKELIPIHFGGEDSWVLTGWIGSEKISRARREHQYFYLDRRPIQNPVLAKALEKAFSAFYPSRHPVAVIHLDLPPESYDVNVHPTKKEVRFHKDGDIFSFLYQGVRKALQDHLGSNHFTLPSSLTLKPSKTPSALQNLEDLILQEKPLEVTEEQDLFAQAHLEKTVSFPRQNDSVPKTELQSPSSELIPFLQVNEQFLLVETQNKLLVIDQYNAHFRVLYDEYLERLREGKPLSAQQLMFPEVLEFSVEEAQILEEQIDRLYKLGFDLSPFGGNTYKLNGLPSDLEESKGRRILNDFLENLKESFNGEPVEHFALSLSASRAFRKGDLLNLNQMNELFDRLMATQNPYVSPRGKSTMIPWILNDLEKKFQ